MKWVLCCNKSIFEHNIVVMRVTLLEVSGKAEWTSRIDLTTPVEISGVTLDSMAFVTPCYRPTKAIQAFLLSCFSWRDHCIYSSDSFFSWNELLRFSLLYRLLASRWNLLSQINLLLIVLCVTKWYHSVGQKSLRSKYARHYTSSNEERKCLEAPQNV